MYIHYLLIPLFFISQVSAFPTPKNHTSFIAPLSRRRNTYQRRIHGTKFSPEHTTQELRRLLVKYQHAPEFLKGLISNPQHGTLPVVGKNTDAIFSPIISVETPFKVPSVSITSGTAKMPLKDMVSDSVDLLYYGPLYFGTPPQELTVDVDTGSADLWIPSDCSRCSNVQFKKGSSSTYSESGSVFEVTYGTGEVSATLAKDVVSVQGLSIQNQTFGAVTSESEGFNEYPNSGLIGMAFSSIASSGQPTFFENLIAEKQLAAPMFSIHLARGRETGSEVCFGCINSEKTIGEIFWIPLISKTYWAVVLESMLVNSTSSNSKEAIAAIDTGTTLIYLPHDMATQFYNMIPGSKSVPQYGPEFYSVPCEGDFTISLSFGGREFAINTLDFKMGERGSLSNQPDTAKCHWSVFLLGAVDDDLIDCMGGILSLGEDFPANLAIVGDEFLKSWYSTYDISNGGRVGFSPSVNNRL